MTAETMYICPACYWRGTNPRRSGDKLACQHCDYFVSAGPHPRVSTEAVLLAELDIARRVIATEKRAYWRVRERAEAEREENARLARSLTTTCDWLERLCRTYDPDDVEGGLAQVAEIRAALAGPVGEKEESNAEG